ncbi:MAG: imidazoleglycerol-phosphate dehydratase HisB [Fimbriimonadaceae bacterium]
MPKGQTSVRYAEIDRETTETRINMVLDLDAGSKQDIRTGIGFFDHMLTQLAFHGHLNFGLSADGDLGVDDHHTIEDVGIVFGKALREALLASDPIVRYSSNHTPMDEALVLVAIDISGRGQCHFGVDFKRDRIGSMATESIREFFIGLAVHGGLTIHVHKLAGQNDHHVCEAIFKGFGRALFEATRCTDRHGAPTTKGAFD